MNIHCIIISWENHHQESFKIAEAVFAHVDKLSVIYSNQSETLESGPGSWIRVPNDYFYGKKFKVALDLIAKDEVLLLIQADANSEDWPSLIARCRLLMESNESIGVWAPDINHSSWTNERVRIAENPHQNVMFVTQTDGIVFSYNSRVLDRLRQLNYENNNLGWGIDWLAICFAYTNDMYVIRDGSITVGHPVGSGYSSSEAQTQMNEFFLQMTPKEIIMLKLLDSFSDFNTTIFRCKDV